MYQVLRLSEHRERVSRCSPTGLGLKGFDYRMINRQCINKMCGDCFDFRFKLCFSYSMTAITTCELSVRSFPDGIFDTRQHLFVSHIFPSQLLVCQNNRQPALLLYTSRLTNELLPPIHYTHHLKLVNTLYRLMSPELMNNELKELGRKLVEYVLEFNDSSLS